MPESEDNLYTREDARELWCPFTRVPLNEGMAANRTASMGRGGYADIRDETRCIADHCMAWRWAKTNDSTSEKVLMGRCGLAK